MDFSYLKYAHALSSTRFREALAVYYDYECVPFRGFLEIVDCSRLISSINAIQRLQAEI